MIACSARPSSPDICNVNSGRNFGVLRGPVRFPNHSLFHLVLCPLKADRWICIVELPCPLSFNLRLPVGVTLRRWRCGRREWSQLQVDCFPLPKAHLLQNTLLKLLSLYSDRNSLLTSFFLRHWGDNSFTLLLGSVLHYFIGFP